MCTFNNEPCMTSPTLIDLSLVKLNYDLFMICLEKCNGSCHAAGDLTTKNHFFEVK